MTLSFVRFAIALVSIAFLACSACSVPGTRTQDTTLATSRTVSNPDPAARLEAALTALRDDAKFDQALALALQETPSILSYYGADSASAANIYKWTGIIYREKENFTAAKQYFDRALELLQQEYSPDSIEIGDLFNEYGVMHERQGEYDRSLEYQQEALRIRLLIHGEDHERTAEAINNLGVVHYYQGNLVEAEKHFRHALQIKERILPKGDFQTTETINNLAAVYDKQRRHREAEPLYRAILAQDTQRLGRNHPYVGTDLNNLADCLRDLHRYEEALHPALEALRVFEFVYPKNDHRYVADSANTIGAIYMGLGQTEAADRYLQKARWVYEACFGADSLFVAEAYGNLGELERMKGNLREALQYQQRAVELRKRHLGAGHAEVATSLRDLGYVQLDLDDERHALETFTEALDILETLSARTRTELQVAGASGSEVELAVSARTISGYLRAAWAVKERTPAEAQVLTERSFHYAQWARSTKTASMIAQMSARFAAEDPALGALLRKRQDLARAWTATDRGLASERAKALAERNAEREQLLQKKLQGNVTELGEIDRRLRSEDFAEFSNLAIYRPIGLEEIQRMLLPDEALIAFSSPEVESPSHFFVWVITNSRSRWFRAGEAREVSDRVTALRAQVAPVDGQPLPMFDLAAAHRVYNDLIAQPEAELTGVKRLLLVADGALQSLPLELLVAAPPPSNVSGDDAYRRATWLGDRYDIAVLPSASSLRALRHHAGRSRGNVSLIALADPAFGTAPAQSVVFASLSSNATQVSDVCALRSVPATARIAESMRQALDADPANVLLGPDASEAQLNRLNASGLLRQARVVAFATHGLTTGEVPSTAEPALALTPEGGCGGTTSRSAAGDGFLTASEILGLHLDADWVLLTACNTAAPDGTGAEPLSGLARAFFYAGARSLLVSHWPAIVSSDPTAAGPTELQIAELFASGRKGLSKAAALRQARQAVRQRYPHPAYWAAFSLVGDGR